MMGPAPGRQDRRFYEFNLEERIPHDHLLRQIDAVLDLGWLRVDLAPFYSHTGCPSVDPELMVRMLLIGYCYSIRSERRLCREVELNLAYRWFCRLGLEDKVPHIRPFRSIVTAASATAMSYARCSRALSAGAWK
jgi:transposase